MTGKALHPLRQVVDLSDLPLGAVLPQDALQPLFERLTYSGVEAYVVADALIVDLELAFEQEIALALPGLNSFALVLLSGGVGWTEVRTQVVIGPQPELAIVGASVGLRVPPGVLKSVATGGPAEISVAADLHVSPAGLELSGVTGADLPPAYVADTKIIVEADDVLPVVGGVDPPAFVDQPDFQGVVIEKLAVTIPDEYLHTDPGSALEIAIVEAFIGPQGFTGQTHVAAADLAHPVTGSLFGFGFRFDSFALAIRHNELQAAKLAVELHLAAFDGEGEQKWVALEVGFTTGGDIEAALASAQPPGASTEPDALVSYQLDGLARLGVRELRVVSRSGVWILFLSGSATLLVGGGVVKWPTLEFEDLGIGSDGKLVTEPGGGIRLRGVLTADLGPFQLRAGGFGLGFDASGSLIFTPPNVIGLAIDTPAVRGGGYVTFDAEAGRYSGVFELTIIDVVSVKVTGILNTKAPDGTPGFALLILITAEGFTPIQLGMGFTLTGIGGLLALNRTVNADAIRGGLQDGVLDSVLFAKDPVRNATRILASLDAIFPLARDRLVIGPLAEISWGTPPVVKLRVALLLEVPQPIRAVLLAALSVLLPRQESAVVELHVDAIGALDLGRGELALDASLHDSRLLSFTLTGDMALRLNWGSEPAFVLSVGGFHPRFTPPRGLRPLKRLALTLTGGDNPRVRLETYLAVTSNTIQMGARVTVYEEAAGFGIDGGGSFDALIQWSPFRIDAAFAAWVRVFGPTGTLLGISVALNVTGPTPWHVTGKATVHVLFFSVSVGVDFTLGKAAAPAPVQSVDVAALLWEHVSDRGSWHVVLSAGEATDVTLALPDPTRPDAAVVAHPLAQISVRQRVVPLGTDVSRLGAALPTEGTRSYVLDIDAPGLTAKRVDDLFAPAQYMTMSDDERLAGPSFKAMAAGVSVQAEKAATVGPGLGCELAVETLDVAHLDEPALGGAAVAGVSA